MERAGNSDRVAVGDKLAAPSALPANGKCNACGAAIAWVKTTRHATDGKCEAYIQFRTKAEARAFERFLPHGAMIEINIVCETGDPWYPLGSVGMGFRTADITAALAAISSVS